MWKNYLKIALRNLRRHLGYSLINVIGLAVGIAVCLLIGLYVHHELSYDRFHAGADQIYRLVETRSTPGGEERVAGTAGPVGPVAVQEVPGVEAATRLTRLFRVTVERGDTRFYVNDYLLAEPSFFEVFGFKLAQGSPKTALSQPGSVVLTHEAARRYFGEENSMGKALSVEAFGEATVTGVLEPLPETSHLQFSMLFPFATPSEDVSWWEPWTKDWAHNFRTFTTYITLDEDASPGAVETQVTALMARNTPTNDRPQAVALQPLADIHLYSADIDSDFNAQPGNPTFLYIFSAIAFFIVCIAAINYMNLATAQSAERTKEVGVRKAVGAMRRQVIGQFLGEAMLVSVAALGLGLFLAYLALPGFSALASKTLSFAPILQPSLLVALGLGALVLGMLAGSYPAFYLSRFDPARTLKGGGVQGGGGAAWLRRGLVVVQFALSIVMIVATLVVAQQLDYVQAKRLGFEKEHLIVVDINSMNVRSNMETMKTEMHRHPAVHQVSVSSRIPGDWKAITDIQVAPPGASDDEVQSAYFMGVDEDFLSTYEIELASGRNFNPLHSTDTTAMLLNETAVRTLGLTDPIGTTIRVPQVGLEGGGQTEATLQFRVIGVVEDFHFQSLYEPIRPLVLGYHNNPIDNIDYFTARVEAGQMQAALDHLRRICEQFDPAHPFEYNFLDQRLAEVYRSDQRVGRIFGVAAGLAILIACFGLFGLAAFTTKRRTKEIGIRKVLGASVESIVALLSKEFAVLVLVAFAVAAPMAYWTMDRWLENFAYRAELSWWLFLLAGLLALAIALLTTSYHAVKAALMDPVKSLRYE